MKNKNIITFDIHHKEKLINISGLNFQISKHNTLYLHYVHNHNFSHELLKKIFLFLNDLYTDYNFWWIEYMEFTSPNAKRIGDIIDVFEEIGLSDKLKFFDNNLKKTNFFKSGYLEGVPTMFGFTADYSLEIEERIFNKKFICLNRVDRKHRKIIFDYLNENYKKESYLSYVPQEENNPLRVILDDPEISKIGNLENAFTSPYQLTSFCNIVNETLSLNDFVHITEKTDKCFSAGQPFIINAGPHYIKYLKKYGFKTFDKWWDESYDEEMDFNKRIKKIQKTIDYIASFSIQKCEEIYKEMIPSLIHNQNLCKEFSNSIWHIPKWDRSSIQMIDKKTSI